MSLVANLRLSLGPFELDAGLRAGAGAIVALVGPNGAGKTTLLRALAGLERLDAGHIELDGRTLDDAATTFVAPHLRSVGLVPQADRLLPHMSALGNVAFGLRCGGVPRRAAEREAAAWLDVVGLGQLTGHRPHQLSGGQAKRVALARALAVRPRLLLLDEPFAGLDATTRGEVRRELRRYLQTHDCVRIVVTHEAVDALALADRIVVLEDGRVVQDVPAHELRIHPRSRYVADFVGLNLYRGTLTSDGLHTDEGVRIVAADPLPSPGAGLATIHPRAVAVHLVRPEGSPRNVWRGTVTDVDRDAERLRVRVDGELTVVAEVTHAAGDLLHLAVGSTVFASAKATEVVLHLA